MKLTDHPHACGDKSALLSSARTLTGSSPRVWGQVLKPCPRCKKLRIIPTRVGTSLCVCHEERQAVDHPHACGDKHSQSSTTNPTQGSSPRVWGQVLYLLKHLLDRRIIPTRVGTRKIKTSKQKLSRDHPHACGDKRGSPRIADTALGSSPRVWGQER